MSILTSFKLGCQRYRENFPTNTPITALQSFAATYALHLVFTGNPVAALLPASMAATASVIHGLISPLFKDAMKYVRPLTRSEEVIRGSIAAGAAYGVMRLIVPGFTLSKIAIQITSLFYITYNLLFESNRDLQKANLFVV